MNQQAAYKEVYDHWFEQYKKRGVPTNEEADKFLLESGDWSKEDNIIVEQLEAEIERLKATAKAERIPTRVANINRQIAKAKGMLSEKMKQKISLRPVTCEMGANLKLNDFAVVTSFYRDQACMERLYSDEDYEEMERPEIDSLAVKFTEGMDVVSEIKIQELALSDFFSPMFSLYSSPKEFFDKPIVSLTRPQITMCFYTKVFKSIFENIPKIPKHVAKNPEALLEFAENYDPTQGQSANRKSTPARESDVGARMIVGATKEDLEAMKADGEIIGDLTAQTLKASKDGSNSARLMDIFNLS